MSERHDHAWTTDHVYLGAGHERAESRTWLVVYLTAGFMVVEIAAGFIFGSVALLADGVHMATHVGALGLAAWAYWMARRHAKNRRFSFGSGKFGDLAGFSSALFLALVAVAVAGESISRLMNPVSIQYKEALAIAAVGLLINIISAYALQGAHDHGGHGHAGHDHAAHAHEGHDHDDHDHDEHDHAGHDHGGGEDLNLRAAYIHVLADAATSVLAIAALGGGALFGYAFLDPVVGLLGAFVIANWSVSLMRQTALVLLDFEDDPGLSDGIRRTLEDDLNVQIADMHLWRLGPGHRALILSLVSPVPCSADGIKNELRQRHTGLSHVTIEVAVCEECAPV